MAEESATCRLTSYPLDTFAAALAARQSTPGGGGASALTGALAAALCSMVARYTVGKKAYAAVEDDVERILAEADEVRVRLVELIDYDAEAFKPLARAFSIPRDDPDRPRALEEATKLACSAPIQIMEACARVVPLFEELAEKGNHLLLSDVLCGAALCGAALQAASANVYVNTSALADRAFADELEGRADYLFDMYAPRAHEVVEAMRARIRKRG